ncbi:glycine receptor subunit alpha-2-like isoform X2 [Amphibalanus amphitrite]|uniref:glycine receptor subunit alpha-2-like isoform X2 n=1 Tax=Amphibalanus amphitrite TaxID=1232801 RepID=UPI001C90CC19|nr:glycine receptor subunit alpha-2-like isoform X2 [Amphibalanus amphitrite]XP_043216801.1 glycine receptor subunit alpha-2-like isoform X2 [Amphibalanus amphitrite]
MCGQAGRLLFLLLVCVSPERYFTLDVIEKKILDTAYDANQWPTFNKTGVPTDVHVEIFINSFGAPRAATMDYHLDIYLRQSWQDDRLRSASDTRQLLLVSRRSVIDRLWTPDIYFLNVKDAKYHDVTSPNVLMRIYADGRVFYSIRLQLTLSCQMDLNKYPLDTQTCHIELATFAHPISALEFYWKEPNPIERTMNMEIPQFNLEEIILDNPKVLNYSTGQFSALSARFRLNRENGYHLLQTYIPTIMIVAISWVSFWLEQTATPARVTLGVTTLLTLTSLAAGVRSELPPVSYLKAIDVWIGSCMFFVFGALLEFVLVHHLAKKRKRRGSQRKSFKAMFFGSEEPEVLDQGGKKETHLAEAKIVDRICRVFMPFAFITFNFAYWCHYGLG